LQRCNSTVTIVTYISAVYDITEGWSLEGISGGQPIQPSAEEGPPRVGCLGPRPGSFWVSLGATCASAWSPSQCKNFADVRRKPPVFSVCAHFLRSCHWTPLERAWLPLLWTLRSGV